MPPQSLCIFQLFVKKNSSLWEKNCGRCRRKYIVTSYAKDLRIPSHMTTYYKKGAKRRALKVYKALPSNIKAISRVNKFIHNVRLF